MKTKTEIELVIHRIVHARLSAIVLVLLILIGVTKLDSRLVTMVRQAYDQGFGMIGAYMREGEMTRIPLNVGSGRWQTISGR